VSIPWQLALGNDTPTTVVSGFGRIDLPDPTHLDIHGGSPGQVLTTDGNAGLTWSAPARQVPVYVGTTPPVGAVSGDLWWDNSDPQGQLYLLYNDGNSIAWISASTLPSLLPGGGTGDGGIRQLTGDVLAGPGDGSQVSTLSNTTVTPGSYTSANLTVDAKGRITAASNGSAAAAKYVMGFSFVGGVLGATQLLGLHKVSKAITIPANFGGYAGHVSEAGATANATGSTVLSVDRAVAASPNTFSQIGTITFGAGTITPTFATSGGASVSLAQGDVVRLTGPAVADTTLANVYVTLVAQET